MTSSKSFYNAHLQKKQGSLSNYKQYPQGVSDGLFLIYQMWALVNGSADTGQSDNAASPYPLNPLIFTP